MGLPPPDRVTSLALFCLLSVFHVVLATTALDRDRASPRQPFPAPRLHAPLWCDSSPLLLRAAGKRRIANKSYEHYYYHCDDYDYDSDYDYYYCYYYFAFPDFSTPSYPLPRPRSPLLLLATGGAPAGRTSGRARCRRSPMTVLALQRYMRRTVAVRDIVGVSETASLLIGACAARAPTPSRTSSSAYGAHLQRSSSTGALPSRLLRPLSLGKRWLRCSGAVAPCGRRSRCTHVVLCSNPLAKSARSRPAN